jgi:hypothetical protein
MSAKDIAQAAITAWEAKDVNSLSSCLSENFAGRGFLPQQIEKQQFIDLMKVLTTAFPDWSFGAHLLTEQDDTALFVTHITGTHTGDLILPTLPLVLPTGQKISLPDRHMTCTLGGDKITAMTMDYPVSL